MALRLAFRRLLHTMGAVLTGTQDLPQEMLNRLSDQPTPQDGSSDGTGKGSYRRGHLQGLWIRSVEQSSHVTADRSVDAVSRCSLRATTSSVRETATGGQILVIFCSPAPCTKQECNAC
mmetsp:Transcript_66814/g.168722  ORF Transcript_66814/g.168722 Transcript_66814/m.168722 type:complete len:119 (-) Transcript_66814:207-563(-)